MGETDYYLLNGDQEQGPWTLGELQTFLATGAVSLEMLYAQPGMSEWKPISELLDGAPIPDAGSSLAAKTVNQPGIQVGFSSVIQSAIEEVAKLIESGAFNEADAEDKATMGWEWYAIHDGHHQNCDKCEFYDGQRWTKDYSPVDNGPEFPGKPPLHRGCHCALIPVDLSGGQPPKSGLDEVFRDGDKRVLETSFGKANVEAFFDGRINGRQLLQQHDQVLSPGDFEQLRPSAEVHKLIFGK